MSKLWLLLLISCTETTSELRRDVDLDGYPASRDCDDLDVRVNPGARELCDGLDNNCDGVVDGIHEVDAALIRTWYTDRDGDGFGWGEPVQGCSRYATGANAPDDCDDWNARVNPGVPEQPANGVDDDCDGFELCPKDEDGDGYAGPFLVEDSDLRCQSPGSAMETGADCRDDNPDMHPAANDPADDGVDWDCDGAD